MLGILPTFKRSHGVIFDIAPLLQLDTWMWIYWDISGFNNTNERTESFGHRLKPLCPIHQECIEITC